MRSILDPLAAMQTAVEALRAVDWDGLPVRDRLEVLERLETVRRHGLARSTEIAASLDHCDGQALGGNCHTLIADVLRISLREARRRLRDGAQLTPRHSLTGEPVPPELPATAEAWHSGVLDPEHLHAIQRFTRELPVDLHPAEVAKAESFLAEKAAELRPDQLEVLADRVALTLNPDGVRTAARLLLVRTAAFGRDEHRPADRHTRTARDARRLVHRHGRPREVQPSRRDSGGQW